MGQIFLDPKPGKIHGFIKVKTAEDPVDNVTIVVTGNSTITGTTGEFIVEAEVGLQKVMIYHPDYETKTIEVNVQKNSIKEIGTVYLLPRPGTLIGSTVPQGATISLYGNFDNYTFTSDEDGDFKATGVASDTYLVEVSADGHYTKSRKNIIITNGGVTDMGIIALDPEVGDVTGRVTREDGVGIANAQVESGMSIVTGPDGYFTLPGLTAGTHSITINASGFETETITNVEVIANTAVDIGSTALKALESGLGDLEVEAFNLAGESIPATITLVEREETINADELSSFKALWEGIPKGPYTVKAEADGYYTYFKDAVVVSDRKTVINFNLLNKSSVVDGLTDKINNLESRSAYWDKEIGYPVEESYTLTEDITPMDYLIQYSGPEDIYVGSSLEDANAFFDFVDENYGELFDADGNAVEVIDLVDENGLQLPHQDVEGNDIKWYGKEPGEEIHLVLSATPNLPDGLTDIVVRYAVKKTMKELAVDALIKRGVTAKEVDVSVVDTISQLKGEGFKWNEPIPEGSTILGLETRVSGNEGSISTNQTSISQNETDIGLHAGRLTTNEGNISANEAAITVNAENITSAVNRLDTNEGNIELNQTEISQNADSIRSTVRHINIDEGSYLRFRGVESWIDFNTLASVPGNNVLSIKLRVNFTDFEGHQALFVGGDNVSGLEVSLYNNNLDFTVVENEVKKSIDYGLENLSKDRWYEIEAIADGPAGKLFLKIDGEVVKSKITDSFNLSYLSEGFAFGTTKLKSPASGIISAEYSNFFSGYLDEIQLWNSYQTTGLMADIEGNEVGLLSGYKIDEGSGLIVNDIKEVQNGIIKKCEWYGIESTTSQVRQLSNEFTVKVREHANGKEVISGFGLASENGESEFSVMADRFFVFGDTEDGAEVGKPIFAVDSTTGNIYIEADLIANGSVTGDKLAAASIITKAAQIENAMINTAHIDYLEIDKLDVRGRLSADHIVIGTDTQYEEGYNPKVINDKLTDDINDLNKSFSSLGNQLSQFVDDLKLTRIEAETLRGSKERVKSEWSSLNTVASSIISTSTHNTTSLADKRTAAENAINELELELNSWIGLESYPVDIAVSDKDNIEIKFDNVMSTKAELLNEITKFRQDAAIAWSQAEINSLETEIQNQIDRFSMDSVITKAEANTLQTTLESLKTESVDLVQIAEEKNIVTIKESYEQSLIDLEVKLSEWVGLDSDLYPLDITTTNATRLEVRTLFDDLESKRVILYNSITDAKQEEAILYSEADIVSDPEINIFHFDKHFTSTKGVYPAGDFTASIEAGLFKNGAGIHSVDEGVLFYNTADLNLNTNSGTISMAFKIPSDVDFKGSSGYKRLFSIGEFAAEGQFIAYYNLSDNTFRFRIHDGTTAQEVTANHVYEPGFKRFTFKWGPDEMAIFIDSEKFIKNSFNLPEFFSSDIIYFGSKNKNEEHVNSVIDEVLISNKYYADEIIKAWHEIKKPFNDLQPKTVTKSPTNVVVTEV